MNNVLRLKGRFDQRRNTSHPGAPELPTKVNVEAVHLDSLASNLERVIDYWEETTLLKNGVLVSAYYRMVVAKSNRIKGLLVKGSQDPNEQVVGAKFSDEQSPKHIITYHTTISGLKESVRRLKICSEILKRDFSGNIDKETLSQVNHGETSLMTDQISKTNFAKVIVDAHFVERFDIDQSANQIDQAALVSLYNVGESPQTVLQRLGIDVGSTSFLNEDTFYATPEQFQRLKRQAPYLIAMSLSDLAKYSLPDSRPVNDAAVLHIPNPVNEPTVGVIDTVFDDNVYFRNWVEAQDLVDERIPGVNSNHGTEVTSIIVDGPSFNPELEDGCGRFRVRHFGVTRGGVASSFTILKAIENIVTSNTDIKVWNLSLGALQEVNRNFISPEAAILDQLENEYDIIFVVAATNRGSRNMTAKRIGAPADSLNSIVVGAVGSDGQVADYSREGPVLSFFTKPDVCYFGGDQHQGIRTCSAIGEQWVTGTSFAAPWITRKVAFLVYIMGFSREVAKALLIDSATGWKKSRQDAMQVGFGVVPRQITDILHSENDEIRFVLSGVSSAYDTYNYNIPIPVTENQFPYIARATLCYFPACSRNQGVDYTNTELDLHFGRLKGSGIKAIDNNQQGAAKQIELYEEDARKYFRKWDNVKHIGEVLNPNARLRKKYDEALWGISMKTKERLQSGGGESINFGLVITLKNIQGENLLQRFELLCRSRGWLVTDIDVQTQIEIYNQADTEVKWN